MAEFYAWPGAKKSARVRLAVMDVGSHFGWRHGRMRQIRDFFDKFHIMRHLGEALDTVRKSEYARLAAATGATSRAEIHPAVAPREPHARWQESSEDLTGGQQAAQHSLYAQGELGQLWSYEREGWARRFFENWRASLKWQRLKPYEMFAAMIDRHWDGIAAYCRPENKVSLGFVEGLNNKIRVIQRRAYGLRNEEYFRLKVLTCMLPEL